MPLTPAKFFEKKDWCGVSRVKSPLDDRFKSLLGHQRFSLEILLFPLSKHPCSVNLADILESQLSDHGPRCSFSRNMKRNGDSPFAMGSVSADKLCITYNERRKTITDKEMPSKIPN